MKATLIPLALNELLGRIHLFKIQQRDVTILIFNHI
jgi:hypothetical protein